MRHRRRHSQARRRIVDTMVLGVGVVAMIALFGVQFGGETPRTVILHTPQPIGGGGDARIRDVQDRAREARKREAFNDQAKLTAVSVSAFDASVIFGTAFSPWSDAGTTTTSSSSSSSSSDAATSQKSYIHAFPKEKLALLEKDLTDVSSPLMLTPLNVFLPSIAYEKLRRRYARSEAFLPKHDYLDAEFYAQFADYFYHKHRLSSLRTILSGTHLDEELTFLKGLSEGTQYITINGVNLTIPHSFMERTPHKRYLFDPIADLSDLAGLVKGGVEGVFTMYTKQVNTSRSGQRPSPLTCHEGVLRNEAEFWKGWVEFAVQRNFAEVMLDVQGRDGQSKRRSEEEIYSMLEGEANMSLNVNVFSVLINMIHDAAVMYWVSKVDDWDATRRRICGANFATAESILERFIDEELGEHSDVVVLLHPPHTLFAAGSVRLGKVSEKYHVHHHPCHKVTPMMCTAPLILTKETSFEGALALSKQVSPQSLLVIASLKGQEEDGQLVVHAMADDFLYEIDKSFKGQKSSEGVARVLAGRFPNRRLISVTPPGIITVFSHDFFLESTAQVSPDRSSFFLPVLTQASKSKAVEMLDIDAVQSTSRSDAVLKTGYKTVDGVTQLASFSAAVTRKSFGLWRGRAELERKQKSLLLNSAFLEKDGDDTASESLNSIPFKDGRAFVRHISGAQGCGRAAVQRGFVKEVATFDSTKSRICAVELPSNGQERGNHYTTSASSRLAGSAITLLFQRQSNVRTTEYDTPISSHGVVVNNRLVPFSSAKTAEGVLTAEAHDADGAQYIVEIRESTDHVHDLFSTFKFIVTAYTPSKGIVAKHTNHSRTTTSTLRRAAPNTEINSIEVEFTFDPPPAGGEYDPTDAKKALDEEKDDDIKELRLAHPFVHTPVESLGREGTSPLYASEETFRSPVVVLSWRERGAVLVPSLKLITAQQGQGVASLQHSVDVQTASLSATLNGVSTDISDADYRTPPLHPRIGLSAARITHTPHGAYVPLRDTKATLYNPPLHSNVPLFAFTLHIAEGLDSSALLQYSASLWNAAFEERLGVSQKGYEAEVADVLNGVKKESYIEGEVQKLCTLNEGDRQVSGVVSGLGVEEGSGFGLNPDAGVHPVSLFAVNENNAFYAFGAFYFGSSSSAYSQQGESMLRLLLSSVQEGATHLFPTVYSWERSAWVHRTSGRQYCSADMGATVFWLFHLKAHFPKIETVLSQVANKKAALWYDLRKYADFIVSHQREDGSIPLYFDEDISPLGQATHSGGELPTIYTVYGSTAVNGIVLAIAANADFFDAAEGHTSFAALTTAAERAAEFIENGLLAGLQSRSRQPLNTLVWIGWHALYLYRATTKQKWLSVLERVAALVSLQQQAWSPPMFSSFGDTFGGFSPYARSGQFSPSVYAGVFLADAFLLTRDPQLLTRSIAAVRSAFAFVDKNTSFAAADIIQYRTGKEDEDEGGETDAGVRRRKHDGSPQRGWAGAVSAAGYLLSLLGDVVVCYTNGFLFFCKHGSKSGTDTNPH